MIYVKDPFSYNRCLVDFGKLILVLYIKMLVIGIALLPQMELSFNYILFDV